MNWSLTMRLLPLVVLLAACAATTEDLEDLEDLEDTVPAEDATAEDCNIVAMDAVLAGSVALDWSAWAPSEEVNVFVIGADAAATTEMTCTNTLVQEFLMVHERVPASEGAIEVSLDAYAGMSLAISLTDADGLHTWVAPIQADGVTSLDL